MASGGTAVVIYVQANPDPRNMIERLVISLSPVCLDSFQIIMLNSVSDLHGYIDKSQLTRELGGTLEYGHSQWIHHRTVSAALHSCTTAGRTNAEQPLSRNFSVALQPLDSARDSGKEEIHDSNRERQIPQKFVMGAVIVSPCVPGAGPNSVVDSYSARPSLAF